MLNFSFKNISVDSGCISIIDLNDLEAAQGVVSHQCEVIHVDAARYQLIVCIDNKTHYTTITTTSGMLVVGDLGYCFNFDDDRLKFINKTNCFENLGGRGYTVNVDDGSHDIEISLIKICNIHTVYHTRFNDDTSKADMIITDDRGKILHTLKNVIDKQIGDDITDHGAYILYDDRVMWCSINDDLFQDIIDGCTIHQPIWPIK